MPRPYGAPLRDDRISSARSCSSLENKIVGEKPPRDVQILINTKVEINPLVRVGWSANVITTRSPEMDGDVSIFNKGARQLV